MLNEIASLNLLAELAMTLVGFTGAVTVLGKSAPSEWQGTARLRLTNLLVTSLMPLFMAFLSLILLHASLNEVVVWRIISAIGAAVFLVTGSVNLRAITRRNVSDPHPNPVVGLLLAVASLIVGLVSLWNGLFAGAFWPVYLLLCSALAIGCYMFVRLIFDPLT
ncbi:MAG: hypothetical protein WA138_11335 [Parvibaculum sp.]